MTCHYWGDETFDWASLDRACAFIGEGLRRWRVDVHQYKEKFGQCRVYCSLGLSSLHQLTHPGYCYNQWPKWAWKLQFTWPARALVRLLNIIIAPLHKRIYRHYYAEAVRRWPHIRGEILCAADWPELLEGL